MMGWTYHEVLDLPAEVYDVLIGDLARRGA